MKALVCEMCNSSEIVKQDGYFVCQHCGMKYAPEEAKKMMIDGPVTVTGTVSIDNSGSYERILSLARDAFTDRSYDKAYEYYCQAVEIKPDMAENVLRQGLSLLGKDGVQTGVPSSSIKRMTRALELLKKMPDSAEQTKLAGTFLEDIGVVCDFINRELKAIRDQLLDKYEVGRSSADKLADLSRPTFVAALNEANDRQIARHNKAIDGEFVVVSNRISELEDFKKIYSEQLAAFLGEEHLITKGIEYIKNSVYESAIACFEKYININPKAVIGYVGKAAALLGKNQLDESSDQLKIAPQYAYSDKEKAYVQHFINIKLSKKYDYTLLHNTTARHNNAGVKLLVELGADVNIKTNYGSTALFSVCWQAASIKEHAAACRDIAAILLNNGASIDVVNKYGISLYNKKTDPKIKAMIRAKYPNAKMGTAQKGCYVATAVYGSYDCPQVWTLRRFRDNILAKNIFGRMFILTYYACSPTLVKWFGNTGWFKKLWQKPLDRMVSKLQSSGVEATPYEDQNW